MVDAAEQTGVQTVVGFNYLKNPMVALAREIVECGEIGEVVNFRGIHAEDYMADPAAPWSWRLDPRPAAAASSPTSAATSSRWPASSSGRSTSLVGQINTVIASAPVAWGSSEMRDGRGRRPGPRDGAASPAARPDRSRRAGSAGRKMTLGFELFGSKGTIDVDLERLNELQLFTTGQPKGREGFKTILAGPEHPTTRSSARRRATSSASTRSRPSR